MGEPCATVIDLLRHGEAVGGARYRDSRDDPLSARGWPQTWARERALPLTTDERLRELELAACEGASAADILETDPDGPRGVFHERARTAWEALNGRHVGAHLLLVISHGGPIRIIVGRLLDLSFRDLLALELRHAGLTRVRLEVDASGNARRSVVSPPL